MFFFDITTSCLNIKIKKRWTLLHETVNLRIHDYFERGKKVKIIVNDETIEAFEGECLSVVLFITNKKNLRTYASSYFWIISYPNKPCV